MEIYRERTRRSSVYSIHTGGIIKEANRHSSTGGWGGGKAEFLSAMVFALAQ